MVNSILNQTYTQWELILIDDGSKDDSFKICSELSANDSRIRAIHKENGGPSSARNLGLEHAGGEYIVFLDSDDYVTPDLLSDYIYADKSDLVISGISMRWGSEIIDEGYAPARLQQNEIFTFLCNTSNFIMNGLLLGSTCNKFYKAGIIKTFQLNFDNDIPYMEDFIFNIRYLAHCDSVTTINVPNYCYIENTNSITHGGEEKSFNLNASNNIRFRIMQRISEVADSIPDPADRILIHQMTYSHFCDTVIRPTYVNQSCRKYRICCLKKFVTLTQPIHGRRQEMVTGLFNKTIQLLISLPAPLADISLKALFGSKKLLTRRAPRVSHNRS